MMKHLSAGTLVLSVLLCGCGNSGNDPVSGLGRAPRLNAVRVLDPEPDLSVAGDQARVVYLTGFDSQGKVVFGPDEESYDEDMLFSGLPDGTASIELDYQRAQGYSLARHRQAVDFAADDDGEIVLDQVSPMLQAGPRSTFTVRLVNNSEYPDDQVFVCVTGKDPAETAYHYLRFGAGDVNTLERFGGVAQAEQYSQALSALKREGDHAYSFQCPYDKLVSGRIYLSFGQKLKGLGLNDVGAPLSLQEPSPTGMPDYQTVFEFMELSVTSPDTANYTLYANTSVVDFFSMGLGMELRYQENQQDQGRRVGFVDNARAQVLQELEASTTPAEFRHYIRKNGSDAILRVLSPVKAVAIEPNGALSRYLDSAIDAGWSHYAGTILNIPDNLPGHRYGYQWSGQPISAGQLSMTCTQSPPDDPASLNEISTLPKPTSRIVFFCDDDAPPSGPEQNSYRNAGSHGHRRLISLLSAALNRGVFETYTDWADSARFFTRGDGKFNHYARVMHKFALDGKVYGFGYDDVYGQDPTLVRAIPQVNQVVITIPRVPRL